MVRVTTNDATLRAIRQPGFGAKALRLPADGEWGKDATSREAELQTIGDLLIKRGATFAGNGELRLTLTREWDDRPKVCFIGHNPSTADHLIDDPTVRRWMHFARAWNRGGFVAVNLYPIRTPDPEKARKWADYEKHGPDWWTRDMLMLNVEIIAREAKACGLVVACWGAIAKDELWNDHVIEEIVTGEEPWPSVHAFRLTAAGAPVHPMARGKHRVPDDAQPIIWRPGA